MKLWGQSQWFFFSLWVFSRQSVSRADLSLLVSSVSPSLLQTQGPQGTRSTLTPLHCPGLDFYVDCIKTHKRNIESQFLKMKQFWESRRWWSVQWMPLRCSVSSPWQQLCRCATTAPSAGKSVRICWGRRTRMELTWSETARPSREPCVCVSSEYSALCT